MKSRASNRITADDLSVIRQTKGAIAQMHRLGILYADIFSPLHDDWMSHAARRLTIMVHRAPLGKNVLEAVNPPVFGRYFMQISTDVDHNRRRFAERHGIGHVVAGHVAEVTYLSDADNWMASEERIADLFALADMVPAGALEELRQAKVSRGAARELVTRQIKLFTHDWPEERVRDRARLRVSLFRLHKL